MRFLHISDLHLGKTFSASRYGQQFARRRRQELLDTFSRLVDFANDNQIDFILCCGDFLNSEELRVEELRNINAIINRLEHAVIVAISGNHDPQLEDSAYRKIEWSRRLYLAPPGVGRVALSTYRTVITCHSWDTKENTQSLELPPLSSRQQGNYQILMLHADTTPNSRYLPVDADALSQLGYDYVALGHLHRPHNPAPNVWYSGSPEPLDFGETGQHGFMMVEISGEVRRCQFIPFSQREYRTLTVQTKADDSELEIANRIAAQVIRENPHHIYTVELRGTHPACAGWKVQAIEDDLRYKEYFCSIIDNTAPEYDLDQLYRENQGNLIGDFIGSFAHIDTPLEQRALQYGLEALLSTRLPSKEQAKGGKD